MSTFEKLQEIERAMADLRYFTVRFSDGGVRCHIIHKDDVEGLRQVYLAAAVENRTAPGWRRPPEIQMIFIEYFRLGRTEVHNAYHAPKETDVPSSIVPYGERVVIQRSTQSYPYNELPSAAGDYGPTLGGI